MGIKFSLCLIFYSYGYKKHSKQKIIFVYAIISVSNHFTIHNARISMINLVHILHPYREIPF